MSKSSRTASITAENAAVETPRSHADRMFRAAQECIRQRQRYARLVDRGAHEDEQQGALRIVCICDDVLASSGKSYEAVTGTTLHRDEDWWHKANSLWHASREYSRRHRGCDETSKKLTNHSPQRLRELAVEYEFEASALLALQHAVSAYRKAAPDAELEPNGAARVA